MCKSFAFIKKKIQKQNIKNMLKEVNQLTENL